MNIKKQFEPTKEQQLAINNILNGLNNKYQTFKGITGSGKTFVLANVIAQTKNPSIILAPNKILAYQLYKEFIELFPDNFIGYYVSNYDTYIPAYYNSILDSKVDSTVLVNQANKHLRISVKEFLRQSDKAILICSTTILFPTFEYDILETLNEHRNYVYDRLKEEKKQVNCFFKENKIKQANILESQINHTIDMMMSNPTYINANILALLGEKLKDFYLFDYFKNNKVDLYIDESHLSMVQINAASKSNYQRLKLLVNEGYYISNVIKDNILTFNDIVNKVNNITFVSATPSNIELDLSQNIVELIKRPNNIPDPKITQKPRDYFGSNEMLNDIQKEKGTIFINCFSRKSLNLLSDKLKIKNISFEIIHHKIKNDKRKTILTDLREGKIKVILGINMLREGIDVKHCTLVIVEDADGGTFLRTKSCLIQISGRASRNKEGKVYMCYDTLNKSLTECINEINKRRHIQLGEQYEEIKYIEKQNIVIKKGDFIKLHNNEEILQIIKYYSNNKIILNNNQQIYKEQIEYII